MSIVHIYVKLMSISKHNVISANIHALHITCQPLFVFAQINKYSNHPITGHPNTGFIRKPDFFLSGFRMVCTDLSGFPDKFVRFSSNGVSIWSDHSKTGPFDNRTQIDHSKTGLVRFSDDYCILGNPSVLKFFCR